MIQNVTQPSLFSGQEGFEEAQKALEDLNKNKRGFYNKDYTKPKRTDNPWQEIKIIYEKIANFLDVPRLQLNNDEILLFCDGQIKAWCYHYTDKAYTYDDSIFIGEKFNIIEAELVGTENYNLDDRIAIHKIFLTNLEDGKTLEDSLLAIQNKLKELDEKYKIGDFAQWLNKHRG